MTNQPDAHRQRRKVEHVRQALAKETASAASWFDEVLLVHKCLPEVDLDQIDTSLTLFGRRMSAPLIVNAMTGGAPELTRLNRELAAAAARYGLPMAVGSQMAAIQDHAVAESFTVVRAANPEGVILANIGAGATVKQALAAIEMLRADALQIHLNTAQELAMREGDRTFSGQLARIGEIAKESPVPVIVKETGSGVAGADASQLIAAGVQGIDVGGHGGTNFVAIELGRRGEETPSPFVAWGIPTAVSVVEVAQSVGSRTFVFASGGVGDGLTVGKCIALGASACGIARPFLKALVEQGPEGLSAAVERILTELRSTMALVGARDLSELRRAPVVIMGRPAEWLERRGYDVNAYARR